MATPATRLLAPIPAWRSWSMLLAYCLLPLLWTPASAYAQSDRSEICAAQRYELSPCITVLENTGASMRPRDVLDQGTLARCTAARRGSRDRPGACDRQELGGPASRHHQCVKRQTTGHRFYGGFRRVGLTKVAPRVMPGLLSKQLQQTVEPTAVDCDHGLFPDFGLCVIRHRQS